VAAQVVRVAVGNIILGVPFTFDDNALRMENQGHFYQLFTPVALLCGVLSVLMVAMHGAVLRAWRTEDPVSSRARNWGRLCALLTLVLFVAGGFWVAKLGGHAITSTVDLQVPSDPMLKTVAVARGAWMAKYAQWPLRGIAPAVGVGGAVLVL
ncbi:cytochrome d ubiquinol oxidase subunit II, partial [Achromobacter xylosoxidans]|uniref:cytochrome d ubiquinol oxidase subunit II n=1 Tax=Alcaligenes xylosoxydans xylosoxydans TaxID=85698 RepID=UPI0037679473